MERLTVVLAILSFFFSAPSLAASKAPVFLSGGAEIQSGTGLKGHTYATHLRIPVSPDLKRGCEPDHSEAFRAQQSIVRYAQVFHIFTSWSYWCFGGADGFAYLDEINLVLEPFLDAQIGDLNDILKFSETLKPYGIPLALSRLTELRDELRIHAMNEKGYEFESVLPTGIVYDNFTSLFYYPWADFKGLLAKGYAQFKDFAEKGVPTDRLPEFFKFLDASTVERTGVDGQYVAAAKLGTDASSI
jgi:hypothetical protein